MQNSYQGEDRQRTEKTPLNFLQAGRTAGPEQRRGRLQIGVHLNALLSAVKYKNREIWENSYSLPGFSAANPELVNGNDGGVCLQLRPICSRIAACAAGAAASPLGPRGPGLPHQVNECGGHDYRHDRQLPVHREPGPLRSIVCPPGRQPRRRHRQARSCTRR